MRAFCWLTAYERDSQTFAIITTIVLGSMGFGVFGVSRIKMTPQELSSRSHPVVFLFLFLPWGILTGYLGVTVSYLLAQAGMSAEQIAGLIALGFIPQTWKFLWAPLVDTTLSQRKWYVLAALVTSDGSVGWISMIGGAHGMFAPLLPRDSYEQVYRNGPDVIIAGSAQPVGRAEAVPGGWRVNGRWPFASGRQHAQWMFGFCVMTEGGKPLPGPAGEEGPPLVRGAFLPARDWRIEDTWYVAGLKGTGSHHITLTDTVVWEANFFDLANGVPCLQGLLYQAVLPLLPLMLGAVSVGIVEGALDELVELAKTGRQQLQAAAPMRDSEIFQGELGRIAAELKAARAFLEVQAASHWRHALTGTLKDEALQIQGTQTAILLATTCVRAVDACFALGGSSALYETSPLQRRLRDLHVVAQHYNVQQRHYVNAGRLLLGLHKPTLNEGKFPQDIR